MPDRIQQDQHRDRPQAHPDRNQDLRAEARVPHQQIADAAESRVRLVRRQFPHLVRVQPARHLLLELRLGHLATAHGEVAVADSAEAADVTVDRNVVGGIGEGEGGLGVTEQLPIGFGTSGIADDVLRDLIRTERPLYG